MKTYLVKFKPMEPYFFGNEKNFSYPGQKNGTQLSNQYFIKSESVPAQTTILGALRYLLLPVKHSDFSYNAEEQKDNNEAVGKQSFNMASDEKQSFGKIKNVSPVFLHDGASIFVITPFDHIVRKKDEKDKMYYPKIYTPFSKYEKVKRGANSEAYYTKEYDTKAGITDSYMNIDNGSIISYSDIFKRVVRTGINRFKDKEGFFKKEYCMLMEDYSFAVYLEYDGEISNYKDVVYLGQGKSAFSVEFTEKENNITKQLQQYLRDDVVYCWGDSLFDESVYDNCFFAVSKIKNYRAYTTNNGRVNKDAELYKLISAGSIFIPKNREEFLKFAKVVNGEQIGYNSLIYKGMENGGKADEN